MKQKPQIVNLSVMVAILTLNGFSVCDHRVPYHWLWLTMLFVAQFFAIVTIFRRGKRISRWWKWYDKYDWFDQDNLDCKRLYMYKLETYLKYGPNIDPVKRIPTRWEKESWKNN